MACGRRKHSETETPNDVICRAQTPLCRREGRLPGLRVRSGQRSPWGGGHRTATRKCQDFAYCLKLLGRTVCGELALNK